MTFSLRPGYGWLVVGAATSVTFLFGIFLSFGVFLDPLIAEFGWSSALTSFIFSIYSLCYSFSAILVGGFVDRYGSRGTIGLGGLICALALSLSSRADAVWQLYLTFGVAGGIGAAAFWIPSTKAVIEYFQSSSSLNLAISIVTTGTGAGMLLISPLAGFFIVEYGWRTCYLLFGLISAIICGFAVLIVKSPQKTVLDRGEDAGSSGQGLSEAMRTRNFWSFFATYVIGGGIARYTVVIYLVAFLVAAGFSLEAGAVCTGLIGAGTILGRIFSGFLSKQLRESRIIFASFVVQGLATIAFILTVNTWIVFVLSLMFGIGYGGYVPQYAILTRESFGMRSFGLVYGAVSSGLGVGALVGPPILGGYLFSVTGSYFFSFVLSGVFSVVAGVVALSTKPPNQPQSEGPFLMRHASLASCLAKCTPS